MFSFRPEFVFRQLRRHEQPQLTNDAGNLVGRPSILMLPWLRTLSIDCNSMPVEMSSSFVLETLRVQQRDVLPCAVKNIVINDYLSASDGADAIFPNLLRYIELLPLLTVLDLRHCAKELVSDSFLCTVALAHPCLQRLYLPYGSLASQAVLDRFTKLEELDISHSRKFTRVDFCATTLRVLYASCSSLTDAGLHRATKLEILRVRNCKGVASVSPFAHCLLELDASGYCAIDNAALSKCLRLQVLIVASNETIDTLPPYSGRLRELAVTCTLFFGGKWNNAALANATQLVKLDAFNLDSVTTIAPFRNTLVELNVSCGCGIDDVHTATNLVCLDASYNKRIKRLSCHVASTLLELDVSETEIGDSVLTPLTNLFWFRCSNNRAVTTVAPFGKSLRHLVAQQSNDKECGLGNAGVATATNLVTLDCSNNLNITSIAFCANSLQELVALDEGCGMKGDEIVKAPQLRSVCKDGNDKITTQHLDGFLKSERYGYVRSVQR